MIRIYTADQRFISSAEKYEIKSLLNYDVHYNEHRSSIGDLLLVNEWRGVGSELPPMSLVKGNTLLLLPLQECFIVKYGFEDILLEVGQVMLLDVSGLEDIVVIPQVEQRQPYILHQLIFSISLLHDSLVQIQDLPVFAENHRNTILPVFQIPNSTFQLYAGAFVGKKEYDLSLLRDAKHTLVTVLSGTFEVEQRLLFTGDHLYLEDIDTINVESLSETGIAIVLSF